jgi:hypothetical protein
MKRMSFVILAATLVAAASPALAAKADCDNGYKKFLGQMSIYVDKMSGYELADAVRKSLDAYNACTAGDDFSPHGVWDKILVEMQAKTKTGN